MSEAEHNENTAGPQRRRRRRSRRRSGQPATGNQGGKTRSQPHYQTQTQAQSKQQSQPKAQSQSKQGKKAGQSGAAAGTDRTGQSQSQAQSQSQSQRSRRRRRGGRGRGGSGPGRQAQANAESSASTGASGGGSATSGGDSATRPASKQGRGKGGSGSGSRPPRKQGERGRSGSRRRGGQQAKQQSKTNRGQQRRPAQRDGQRMRTSIETSAGGLVVSGLAEAVAADGSVDLARIYVALIGRLDRRGRLLWSMPKGHVEPDEDFGKTAEREVWEETGIHGEVLAELGVIDYWFVSEGTRIHKTVHHHLLRFVDGDLNDEDPEVTEVAWVPAATLVERLAYADERRLARRAHDLLPELARAEKDAGRATPR